MINSKKTFSSRLQIVNLIPKCNMIQHISDGQVPRKNRKQFLFFYFATIIFLLGVIVVAFLQKQHEGAIGITVASGSDPQQFIQCANDWRNVSFATAGLAILFWGISLWYQQKHRWAWMPVIALLLFYVLLQLLIV